MNFESPDEVCRTLRSLSRPLRVDQDGKPILQANESIWTKLTGGNYPYVQRVAADSIRTGEGSPEYHVAFAELIQEAERLTQPSSVYLSNLDQRLRDLYKMPSIPTPSA